MKYTRRQGTTLLEMLIVLTILAIALAIVSLAPRQYSTERHDLKERIQKFQRRVIASGRDSSLAMDVDGRPVLVRAFTDGYVVVDSAFDTTLFPNIIGNNP